MKLVSIAAYRVTFALLFVAILIVLTLIGQTFLYELDPATQEIDWRAVVLVASATVFGASVLTLLTRRPIASVALAAGILVLLTCVSIVKYRYLQASLLALDFYFYARSAELTFFAENFPKLFLTSAAVIVAVISAAFMMYRFDNTRVPRKLAIIVLAIAGLAFATESFRWRQRGSTYHFNRFHQVSSLIASIPDAMDIFWQGGLLKSSKRGGTINSEPVPSLQNLDPNVQSPTIISILHESTFPLSLYPKQCKEQSPALKSLYESSDGERYDLRVETFGGGTWITEYGFQLGISTYFFGSGRGFIGYSMKDRVHDSLALQLHQDGYKTIALYPSPRTFVNTGPFYASIGFDEVLDYNDMHQNSSIERDRFYYAKAIDQIRIHKASGSSAPLYLDLWTMVTHAPYDYKSYPELEPHVGEDCASNPGWGEYIRRLTMAQDDLLWLREQLKTEFPGQPFMILGFGDHQPGIANELLHPGHLWMTPTKNTSAYTTFFRIEGVNFEPDFSHVPKSIDIPFLGNVMMLAARLPRHGFYNDRDKLMQMCSGRYNDCPQQDEILNFHQRLIDSAMISNH